MSSDKNDLPHDEALSGSRSLVIGGSSGIGFAVASGTLAVKGSVFISSSSQEKVDRAVSRLKQLYPDASVSGAAADLSDRINLDANVKDVLDKAVSFTGGPLNHILSTAGSRGNVIKLEDLTADTIIDDEQQTLRILMPMLIAKLVSKYPGTYLNRSTKSSITLTSGVVLKKPMPGNNIMIASAGAIDALSRGLAVDLKPIRVNVMTPGALATEMTDERYAALKDRFAKATLVGEVGRPRDAAEAYLFAMRSRFMTGQEVVVDGGFMLMSAMWS